jgi:aminoglycoside phosphotransferase (APT) family kinase protein
MAGATSSSVHGIETGGGSRLILRLFTNEEWLSHEPDLAAHEAWALQRAAEAGIPTPGLVAFDETGEEAGVPAVLMTRLEGRVDLNPADMTQWLEKMAETLIPLHQLSADDSQWTYYPYIDLETLATPSWSANPRAWERAISIVQGGPPEEWTCFIHRDYHPNNVLWEEDRLSGIVDWPNACRGPAMIDLAHCRQNLAQMYGIEPAAQFLTAYIQLADKSFSYHPYWDLIALVEHLAETPRVYPGWPAHGLTNLTPEVVRQRLDNYIANVLSNF